MEPDKKGSEEELPRAPRTGKQKARIGFGVLALIGLITAIVPAVLNFNDLGNTPIMPISIVGAALCGFGLGIVVVLSIAIAMENGRKENEIRKSGLFHADQ